MHLTNPEESKIITMNTSDLQPHVRFLTMIQCESGFDTGLRKIYDHQFHYIHAGKGKLSIDGEEYEAFPGDLFFYEPGVSHSITADKDEPFMISGIHFDFSQRHRDRQHPIGPFSCSLFEDTQITELVRFDDFPGFPSLLRLTRNELVRKMLLQIVREFFSQRLFYQNCVNGLFHSWLVILMRLVTLEQENIDHDNTIDHIIEYLEENYDQNITSKDIAQVFYLHPSSINKLMRSHTGMSFKQYVMNLRIRQAIGLLLSTDKTVSEISREVGYENVHYFSRLIKQKTGSNPNRLRDSL